MNTSCVKPLHRNSFGDYQSGFVRTPNTSCCICQKPLYRRPHELKKVRHVACMEHRGLAQSVSGLTDKQKAALTLGRPKGTNHLEGIPKSESSNLKRSRSIAKWCEENPDKVAARSKKVRGENHYQWKGGASRLSRSIRLMTEHRKWSNQVVDRDGACMHCGSTENLEAHHVKFFSKILEDNNIQCREQARACFELWDTFNGLTLCTACHCNVHGQTYTPAEKRIRKVKAEYIAPSGSANPNWKGGPVTINCPQCGCDFFVKKSEVSKRKYCSRNCVNESQRRTLPQNAK